MKLLLDSHVLVWWWTGDAKLRLDARQQIESTPVVISAVSYWELGAKIVAGKLEIHGELDDMVASDGFEVLDIKRSHVLEMLRLPLIHRDPFDRMLVAQARCENLVLMSADHVVRRYDVPLLRA